MLYIHLDEVRTPRFLMDIDGYFNRNKEKKWFNDPYVKKIIKEIDNTVAVKDEYLESPVFGGISPVQLSTGCKALILAYEVNEVIYATWMGDNCVQLLLDMAEKKDVHIMLRHCLPMPYGIPLKIMFIDTNKIVTNYDDYVTEYYTIIQGGL